MLSLRVGAAWNSGAPSGGTLLHGLVPFGDLSFATSLQRCTDNGGGGGMLEISWSMVLPSLTPLPSQIRQGSLVELYVGSLLLGMGVIAETPRGSAVTADGLFRLSEHFRAVDAGFLPTTNVRTAVQQAIGRGLRWRDPGNLPNVSLSSLSEDAVQFNSISALLNAYCRHNGLWWWIDAQGFLRIAAAPESGRRWALSPMVPAPETADEEFVSRWFVRRVDGVNTDGQPNAWAGNTAVDASAAMVREDSMDLEQMGYMDSTAGTAAARALLDANKARSGYTEGVSVARGEVTSLGQVAPELWMVGAGDSIRQTNWVTAAGGAAFGQSAEWVAGGTRWKQGEPLQITPLGLVPRTVAAIVQDAKGKPELVFK